MFHSHSNPKDDRPALQYSVHPLVLLNISDHFNRIRLQNTDSSGLVFGAFIGTQIDLTIEVFTSFEINVDVENRWVLDTQFFTQRLEQYKIVFPDYDFIGWYSTSLTEPAADEFELNAQFQPFNDTPIYGRLDPKLLYQPQTDSNQIGNVCGEQQPKFVEITCARLPFTLYECRSQSFHEVPIKIDMGEAERIAVENIAKDAGSASGPHGPLIAHLTSQRNALNMLHVRVQVLLEYVHGVQAGRVHGDPALLRQIGGLTHQLPCISGPDFEEQFSKDYNDVLVAFYLAMLTKLTHQTNNLVDKHLEVVATAPSHPERGPGHAFIPSRRGPRNRNSNKLF